MRPVVCVCPANLLGKFEYDYVVLLTEILFFLWEVYSARTIKYDPGIMRQVGPGSAVGI